MAPNQNNARIPNQAYQRANNYRRQAVLNPANTRDNIDMGDSLQEILDSTYTPQMTETTTTDSPENWKDRTLQIYFQNVNGLQ
jgi:hypothetical protein